MLNSIIQRIYQPLEQFIQPGRVLIIYGPRQVGKTTLINQFASSSKLRFKIETGDDIRVQSILGSNDVALLATITKQ